MGYLFYLLSYLLPLVVGIFTIFAGSWLSKFPSFLVGWLYEAIARGFKQKEIGIGKAKLFLARITEGLCIGILNEILVSEAALDRYILLAVFLAFLIKFSEGFNEDIYYEVCGSNEREYKTLLYILKGFNLAGYLVTLFIGITLGS